MAVVSAGFEKAFDSVSRSCICQVLRTYNVPEVLVNGIFSLYKCTEAGVITCDGLSDLFQTSSGAFPSVMLPPFPLFLLLGTVSSKPPYHQTKMVSSSADERAEVIPKETFPYLGMTTIWVWYPPRRRALSSCWTVLWAQLLKEVFSSTQTGCSVPVNNVVRNIWGEIGWME